MEHSTFNSDALQEHLRGDDFSSNGETLEKREYNIRCPQAVTKSNDGFNAFSDHCEIRLLSHDIPLCCRRCAEGVKVQQRLGISLTGIKVKGICACGEPKEYKKSLCVDCRAINLEESLARAEKVRSKKYKSVKCACGNKREVNHKYCVECKSRTPQERKNAQRRNKYFKENGNG